MGLPSLGGYLSGAGSVNEPSNAGVGRNFTGLYNQFLGSAGPTYAAEAQYQPQYVRLGLGNTALALGGDQNTPGALSLYGGALSQLGGYSNQANAMSRAGDVGILGALGPQAMDAYRSVNPQLGQSYDNLLQNSQDQLNLGGNLDPRDVNRITQQVRSDWAARGLGTSAPAQLDEAMQLYGGGDALRQQRQQYALGAAQAAQGYTQPIYNILTQQSQVPGQAQQFLSGAAASSPSLFNSGQASGLLSDIYGQRQANARATAGNNTGLFQAMDSNLTSGTNQAQSSGAQIISSI